MAEGNCQSNKCKVRTNDSDVTCGTLVEKVVSSNNSILVTVQDVGGGVKKLNVSQNPAFATSGIQSVTGAPVNNADPLNPVVTEADPIFDAWRDAGLAKNLAETVTQIDWHGMQFKDASNKLSMALANNQRIFYDPTPKKAMEFTTGTRTLYNEAELPLVQWTNNTLYVLNPSNGVNTLYIDEERIIFKDPDTGTAAFVWSSVDNAGSLTCPNPTNGDGLTFTDGFRFAGKWGFDSVIPSLTQTGYTVTNGTTDRTLDVTGNTLAQGLAVLGTLIEDLKVKGVIST